MKEKTVQEMLETVQEEIGYINESAGGDFFYATIEIMGLYVVRMLAVDGHFTETPLKDFYKENFGDE